MQNVKLKFNIEGLPEDAKAPSTTVGKSLRGPCCKDVCTLLRLL